jgi:hypothetical protein
MLAPSAHADTVTCAITGTSPAVVTLGVGPEEVVFGVQTDCDGAYPVSWSLRSDITVGSSGASWLLLRNYHFVGPQKFTYLENAEGRYKVNLGNSKAGVRPLSATAFYDADHSGNVNGGEVQTVRSSSFIAKRATAVNDVAASTTTAQAGESVTITGSLQRANWDTEQYDGFAAPVELQFRPDGGSFGTVTSVADDGTGAAANVEVTETGTWRYHYAGDDISGASDSEGVRVVVGAES